MHHDMNSAEISSGSHCVSHGKKSKKIQVGKHQFAIFVEQFFHFIKTESEFMVNFDLLISTVKTHLLHLFYTN
jgi:hypothetical protein